MWKNVEKKGNTTLAKNKWLSLTMTECKTEFQETLPTISHLPRRAQIIY